MHETYDARQPEWNLAVLLIEFFELYGHKFNYHNVGIRIQNGGSYVPKQQLCELSSNGTVPSYLYIEDPANTGQSLNSLLFTSFLYPCLCGNCLPYLYFDTDL